MSDRVVFITILWVIAQTVDASDRLVPNTIIHKHTIFHISVLKKRPGLLRSCLMSLNIIKMPDLQGKIHKVRNK